MMRNTLTILKIAKLCHTSGGATPPPLDLPFKLNLQKIFIFNLERFAKSRMNEGKNRINNGPTIKINYLEDGLFIKNNE